MIARTPFTSVSFVPLRKVKPIGIPIIVEIRILLKPVIFDDFLSCNTIQIATANDMKAERGAAVLTPITNVSNGIAIKASPNPKVALRIVDIRIMSSIIMYSLDIKSNRHSYVINPQNY